ncbi:MAG TPA: MraY family glycosyltransferase [Longimicrobium sp.]|nr:MraY family glycosyltransferase [Longimicrobium sp.]
MPRLGGVAVFASSLVGVLCTLVLSAFVPGAVPPVSVGFAAGLAAAGGALFGAGLADDFLNLPPRAKLALQCAAALLAWAAGFRIEEVAFGATGTLGWMSLPLTVLWVVGVTNAFNLIDGLDGLATGVALVALSTTLALALALGNTEVTVACAVLGGALLGFLPFNMRPALIFLGDSGSMFVGFVLAVLSVHGSIKSATAVLTVVPLLVLALPLLDVTLAILRRWLRGTPVFGADERHLHHRLVAIGLTHTRAAVLLLLVAALMASLALAVALAPSARVAGIAGAGTGACVLLLLFGIKRLGYHEFVEAAAAVTHGASRFRRTIRDRIHARDVAQLLSHAETLEHVHAILHDNSRVQGFLWMGLCRESSGMGSRATLPPEQMRRALRVDYPLAGGSAADPFVLRVWYAPCESGTFPEIGRTLTILAHAIEQRVARPSAPLHPPPPAPEAAEIVRVHPACPPRAAAP